MKTVFTAALALVALGLAAQAAQACHGGGCCAAPCYSCCPQVCVTWVEKEVTCYKPAWKSKEVEYTYNKVVCKNVTSEYTCTVYKPVWKDKTVTQTYYVTKSRQVTHDVTCYKPVQVQCTDCCGCCYTCCKMVPYTAQVTSTQYYCVPKQKEVNVKVCSYKPVKKTYQVTRVVATCKPVTATRTVKYCVMVPYKATVKVPVYSCAPAPCGGCGY
jgi:hypothetical protein